MGWWEWGLRLGFNKCIGILKKKRKILGGGGGLRSKRERENGMGMGMGMGMRFWCPIRQGQLHRPTPTGTGIRIFAFQLESDDSCRCLFSPFLLPFRHTVLFRKWGSKKRKPFIFGKSYNITVIYSILPEVLFFFFFPDKKTINIRFFFYIHYY